MSVDQVRNRDGRDGGVVSGARAVTRLLLMAGISVLAGACSGSNPLSGALTDAANAPPAQAQGPRWTSVAMPPVTGSSPEFTDLLVRRIDSLAQKRSIALLVDPKAKAERTLQGMLAVERKKTQVTIVYLWDVLDGNGKLVNRVEGQETVVVPANTKDVWSAIPVVTTTMLADKAMAAIDAALRPASVAKAGGG